jgi:hypothetical protein
MVAQVAASQQHMLLVNCGENAPLLTRPTSVWMLFACHASAPTLLLINTSLRSMRPLQLVMVIGGGALRALMLLNERLELRLEQMSEVHHPHRRLH